MGAIPAPPPEQGSTGEAATMPDSQLLIDRFLPTYDVEVVHAAVFRAPPPHCYRVASELDLFRTPLVRALIGIRTLPQRVARTRVPRGSHTTSVGPPRTFRA